MRNNASVVMKMKRSHQLDYQLEPRRENCPETSFGYVKVDPTMLPTEAQQHERKRIAQELHDTLLQGFTSVAFKLDAVKSSLPPALSKTKRQLEQTLEQMDHCLGETRRSIWNLRSQTLESTKDLSRALLEASKRALAGSAIGLSFSVQGAPRKIGTLLEHHLLRICEEGLANIVKHAHPTRVEVVLGFTSNEVELQIRDNGCGFEPKRCELSKSGHFGLLGIKERVVSLCGMHSLDSAPGRGTRLIVTIPIEPTLRVSTRRTPSELSYCRGVIDSTATMKPI